MNKFVAKELSEALARCQQNGIDAGTVRTGLLTITIANFVHGIGLENTLGLFQMLPQQIQSGLFDKFSPRGHQQAPHMQPLPRAPMAPVPPAPPVPPTTAAPSLPPSAVTPYGERNPGISANNEASPAPPIRRRRL